MAKKNNNSKKPRPLTLLKPLTEISRHPALPVPVRKPGWKALLVGGCGLSLILTLFVLVEQTLDTLEAGLRPVHHSSDSRIQVLNEQMQSLHGKFSLLLAESVELKLKALSKDMEAGKLDPEDARLFSELEKELLLLEQYSATAGSGQLESGKLEHPRFKAILPPAPAPAPQPDDELARHIKRLRHIVYFSLSALGVTLLILLGRWSLHTPGLVDHQEQPPYRQLPKPDDETV
jgi:hypothetical protein